MRAENKAAGIGLMVLGMGMFALNDALGKWLSGSYSVPEILTLRSAAALLVLLPLVLRRGWRRLFAVAEPRLHVLRLVVVVAEVSLFYASVRHLALADTLIIYQAAPLFVTALSLPVLGERVGPRRWAAVLLGFCGVFLVVQPGWGTLSLPALTALGGSLGFASVMLLTRRMRGTDGLGLIFVQVSAVGLAGLAALPFAWSPVGSLDLLLLAALGVTAMIAYFMINTAMTLAPAAVTAPFQYVTIPIGILLGWMVWGDVPTSRVLIGCGLIVGCGLFILYRESRVHVLAARRERPAA